METEQIIIHSAVVAGLVAALRDRAPRIDGWLVWLVAVALSIGIAEALAPGLPAIADGLKIAGGAIGGVSIAKYAAGKVATSPRGEYAIAALAGELPPDAEVLLPHDPPARGIGPADETPITTSQEVSK